jgi:sporulation-control protein
LWTLSESEKALIKNFIVRFGVGAAQVELVLEAQDVVPGEKIKGFVTVRGGQTEQQIDSIYFAFLTKYFVSDKAQVVDFGKQMLTRSFKISPGEVKDFDVILKIPETIPITTKMTRVWVQTGLDIDWSIDPTDKDFIRIERSKMMETLTGALHMLGFDQDQDYCVKAPKELDLPFIQEFEYSTRTGPFKGRVDHLEIICVPKKNRMDVVIGINHSTNVVSELLGLDNSEALFRVFDNNDVHELTQRLQKKIEKSL